MYGDSNYPYAVISYLGEWLEATIEPGALLTDAVRTVAAAFRVPYAAIAAGVDREVIAAWGTPTGAPARRNRREAAAAAGASRPWVFGFLFRKICYYNTCINSREGC